MQNMNMNTNIREEMNSINDINDSTPIHFAVKTLCNEVKKQNELIRSMQTSIVIVSSALGLLLFGLITYLVIELVKIWNFAA